MDSKYVIIVFGILSLRSTFSGVITAKFNSHSINDYEIITIYKLQTSNNAAYTCPRPDKFIDEYNYLECNDIEIHSRSNAIGMPIEFNGRVLSSRKNDLEFIVDSYYPKKYLTNNHVEYNPLAWVINSTYVYYTVQHQYLITKKDTKIKQAAGGLLSINLGHGSSFPFNISWTSNRNIKMCVSLTYRTDKAFYQGFDLAVYKRDNNTPIISHRLQFADELMTLVLRANEFFLKEQTYDLIISHSVQYYTRKTFGIKRIAQCDEYGDVYEIPGREIKGFLPTANVYQVNIGSDTINTVTNMNDCKSNKYGINCTGVCSTYKTFCQHLLFCTSSFECSCASGYTGRFCDKKCQQGTYGRDCKSKCADNCNLCDIYTGTCIGGCKSNYILPNCTEKYPWLINPPQFISSDYDNVILNLSLVNGNFAGSKQKTPLYYQIVYKQSSSKLEFQNSAIKKIGNSQYKTEIIDNLHSGTEYLFGAIIITEDGHSNVEDISTINYKTSCQIPMKIDYGVQVQKGVDNLKVTWKEHNTINNSYECEPKEYKVKLFYNVKYNMYEAYSTTNQHVFDTPIYVYAYAVQVTAMTVLGPTEPSEMLYGVTDVQGFISIKNITANLLDSDTVLHLTWKLSDSYVDAPINYIVKYKVNRHYSCSYNTVNSSWTKIVITSTTEYDILHLIPNSQYVIQVEPSIGNDTSGDEDNLIFVKTPSSLPQLAPVTDSSQQIFVSNQSAIIKWIVDKNDCNKLNGFFTGYYLTLKSLILDSQKVVIETENTIVELNGLIPNTDYELQVYIKTNKGFNLDYNLTVPFRTKSKFLSPVQEIWVYKKNITSRSIGLRWSHSNDSDVNGFIIQVNTNSQKANPKQVTVEPSNCKAWPTFYCTTVENLTPNTEYSILVKAKSKEYPTGGLPTSVNFITTEGIPDEPRNLKITHVGSNNITLEWDIPWMFNGVLNAFIINVKEVPAVDSDFSRSIELQVTEELPTYNYSINNLKPGSNYTIGVSSKTSWYEQTGMIYKSVTTLNSTP